MAEARAESISPEEAEREAAGPSVKVYNTDPNSGLNLPDNLESQTQEEFTEEVERQAAPDKFEGKSREEILEMYRNLEQKLGQPKPEAAPQSEPTDSLKVERAPKPEGPPPMEKWAEHIYGDGDMPEEVTNEIAAAHNLTAEQVQELRGMLKTGHDAQLAQRDSRLFEAAGGRDEYLQAAKWAAENYTDEQLAMHNQLVSDRNENVAKEAALNLMARFRASAAGSTPIDGEGGPVTSQTPFRSYREYMNALHDPQYDSSPEYRHAIDRRIDITDPRIIHNAI